MIICCKCGNKVPFRCLLFSPGLSVADVECPYCTYHLHAGRQCRRIIWAGLILGGLLAAAGAYSAWYFLDWSIAACIGILLIIAILVAAVLTSYTWRRNDFYITD